MKYKPHDYQAHAIDFLQTHDQAALFLEMGLGKTIITLTAMEKMMRDTYQVGKCLIVAPVRVARDTWPDELEKWDHLAGLTLTTMVGSKQQRLDALNTESDFYTIGRENIPWLVDQVGKKWPFDTVVIDELSSFKNPQAKRFKALKAVRPHIRRIYGLTGTPAPNGLLDIWAPFRLIDEGERLGKYITHYRNEYFVPDKRSQTQIFSWKLRAGAEDHIYKRIGDITMSMKSIDHLELPEVVFSDRVVEMSAREARVYERLKKDMVTAVGDSVVDAANAASLMAKLLQLAGGAIYVDEDGGFETVHSRKIDALKEVIEEAQGQSVLVCWGFKHERERILNAIPEAQVLDSREDFRDWNAGKVAVGLIHPASAGHGLNLQAGGHILVWFSTPWSLELYEQTNARLHRQGQEHPVSVVHISTRGTVDRQVRDALERKSVTQEALVDAVKATLQDKTRSRDE